MVLLSELSKSDTELIEILLSLRLNSKTDNRLREGHLLEDDRCVLSAKSITGVNLLETYSSADITCSYALHWVLLVSVHLVDTADTLTLTATRVINIRTSVELT